MWFRTVNPEEAEELLGPGGTGEIHEEQALLARYILESLQGRS